jgi:hypothetical protein
MAEEPSTEKAAVKAAEHEERVTKREQAADKTGQGEPRRPEEEGRGEKASTARQAELTAVVSYGNLAGLNHAGMEATLKAGEAMLKATSSLTEELTSFACHRLRTDVETGRSLMSSSDDWGQAINLQGKFAANAMHDYLEEMTKIANLAAKTTQDVWAPLQDLSTRLVRGELGRPS